MAIILAAKGVLAVPAKTATKPRAANVALSTRIKSASIAPACAPTKKIGVTTPPIPPAAKVTEVVIILYKKPKGDKSGSPFRAISIPGIPKPR